MSLLWHTYSALNSPHILVSYRHTSLIPSSVLQRQRQFWWKTAPLQLQLQPWHMLSAPSRWMWSLPKQEAGKPVHFFFQVQNQMPLFTDWERFWLLERCMKILTVVYIPNVLPALHFPSLIYKLKCNSELCFSRLCSHVWLRSLTLEMTAAEIPSKGLMERMTRVSFQPLTKPMMKPVKKVVRDWINVPSLSAMPSFILKMSLKREQSVIQIFVKQTFFFKENCNWPDDPLCPFWLLWMF